MKKMIPTRFFQPMFTLFMWIALLYQPILFYALIMVSRVNSCQIHKANKKYLFPKYVMS